MVITLVSPSFISILVINLIKVISCRDAEAEVTDLPGLKKQPNFRHYSGYLNASDTHFLHYWFVESQNDPARDPLLLWMNGGPGCSSLMGLLSELGPFLINDDATLRYNPYSWNKRANVIFLEAPAGVGFSYSSDGQISTDDDQTSAENYAAIKQFFSVFPEFRENNFYITGESYGGIYVPTLAQRVILGIREFPMNLKGIAIGNGLLDSKMNTDTLIEFAYNHGLVDEKTWNVLDTVCCGGCADTCHFSEAEPGFCSKTVDSLMRNIFGTGLNMYDLYRDCYNFTPASFKRFEFDMRSAFPKHRRVLNEVLEKKLSQHKTRHNERGAPPCTNDTAAHIYLNSADVKKALHIKEDSPQWETCSENVENHYKNLYQTIINQFQLLSSTGIRTLVYNGDTDMACNFLMNQKFLANLNRTIISPKKPWFFNNQIAGYITQYKNLDFVIVKGTGHMVPQWKPAQAYYMIKSFLDNVSLRD